MFFENQHLLCYCKTNDISFRGGNDMTVGRNDPCPCGSGKKYKQCCLLKENEQQHREQRRGKFYEAKQDLVEKIGDYLVQQIPIKQYEELNERFKERTQGRIDTDIEESYFTFWLYFFHEFENGKRGIELFYDNYLHKLTDDEKQMIKNWVQMRAQFLQLVNQTDDTFIYEDLRTHKRYPVSADEENVSHFYPWMGTLAMIEKMDDLYYFNGLRITVPPYNLQHTMDYMEQLMAEHHQSEDEIIQHYFPELLAKLFESPTKEEHLIDVTEYSLTYSLSQPEKVIEFLKSEADIRGEEIDKNKFEFVWAGNWRICKDNACPSDIQLGDVFGNLFLQDKTLVYVGIEKDKQQEMKERLKSLGDLLVLENEAEKVIDRFPSKPNNVLVMVDEYIPEYFTFYAQNNILKEIDEPIPLFDNKTLRELIKTKNDKKAIEWLKNLEFNVYRQVTHQFEDVEVTADFNTIRKELGLEPSPFVTGGTDRQTTYHLVTMD